MAAAVRLLVVEVIYDGESRGDAAATGGVGLQVIRNRVLRFNAEVPSGFLVRKAPGAARKLGDEHRRTLDNVQNLSHICRAERSKGDRVCTTRSILRILTSNS